MAHTPFTIGITGGSGSGKTYFIKKLESCFSPAEICLVSQDHYYKERDLQVTDERGVKNFDLPHSIDENKLREDILKLKRGEKLFKTEYTFNNPAAKPKILEFNPAPILIIEGLFVQYFPDGYPYRFFLDGAANPVIRPIFVNLLVELNSQCLIFT